MSASVPVRRPRFAPVDEQLDLFSGSKVDPVSTSEAPACVVVAATPASRDSAHKPRARSAPVPVNLQPSVTARPETLTQVLALFTRADATRRDREAASAVRMVGKVMGKDLDQVPAAPARLTPLLNQANPALIGMRAQRWKSVRTSLRWALTVAGYEVMPGRNMVGLTEAWGALEAKAGKKARAGLSRFIRYCVSCGIEPDDVRQDTFDAFELALKNASLQSRPAAIYAMTVKLWSEAARTVEGWPSHAVERRADPRRYALPASAFPESLRRDVEAYASRAVSDDPFADDFGRPNRKVTVDGELRRVFQVASALVMSGVPIADVTSLSVLVDPSNARQALETLFERNQRARTPQLANQARTLVKLATRWVKSPDADVKVLRGLVERLAVKQSGMTEKNRDRLKQFRLRSNQDELLRLADRVLKEALERDVRDGEEARRVLYAMAVEFLTVAPIRIKNLSELDLDKHLVVTRRGGEQILYIKIPRHQTKNSVLIDIPLPDATARNLSIYLKTYRPMLCEPSSRAVFPGRNGAFRNPSGFGAGIGKFILKETGLVMNPHLFRSFAVDLLLERRPEAIETARRLLNHKHVSTTLNYYAELKTEVAFRDYDQILASRRRELESNVGTAKPKRGR